LLLIGDLRFHRNSSLCLGFGFHFRSRFGWGRRRQLDDGDDELRVRGWLKGGRKEGRRWKRVKCGGGGEAKGEGEEDEAGFLFL
jgi:hypothetical protein